MEIDQFKLDDDGKVPNHSKFPLLIYHGPFLQSGSVLSSSKVIDTFTANGWRGTWENGIFPYHHYHARSHEVLANVGGPVEVQFGGSSGPVLTFHPGAVVIIPAGVGHCRISNDGALAIVGAYPAGQENCDIKSADNPAHYELAKQEILQVALPDQDPVTGKKGPLLDHWI